MDIVVTIKQVPDPDIPPSHFKVDAAANRLVPPDGVAPVMNGYDANAVEEALRLRDDHGGNVTVVTVGPDSAKDALKRAIAMGADAAVHVNDPALNEGDAALTAQALAAAIRQIGSFDLVLCGRQASDTDGGQVHLGLSVLLGLPVISPVQKVESVKDGAVIAERIVEDGKQRVKAPLPALLGVSSELNEPRYPPLKGIMTAGRVKIPMYSASDLGLGDAVRRVETRKLYVEAREANVELITGDSTEEIGTKLADKLREARLI